MSNKAPGFEKNPAHRVDIAPSNVHVKVEINGEVVAETKRTHASDIRRVSVGDHELGRRGL